MRIVGKLSLRDRIFQIVSARVWKGRDLWNLEFETQQEEYDGESWSPVLYHQGLSINADSVEELSGTTIQWKTKNDGDYSHPEIAMMYVFGHHDVRNCVLSFGSISDGRIEITWLGECDVFWDDEYKDNVPFSLVCHVAADL